MVRGEVIGDIGIMGWGGVPIVGCWSGGGPRVAVFRIRVRVSDVNNMSNVLHNVVNSRLTGGGWAMGLGVRGGTCVAVDSLE